MIIYEGPSKLTGRPIVAIATGLDHPSKNRKTGEMIQIWILPVDLSDDVSVCGDCPLRGKLCYVNKSQAPLAILRKYKRGGYPPFDAAAFRDKIVRFGAWGDPAALPAGVVRKVIWRCKDWTGYTHQWRARRHKHLRKWFLASVESMSGAAAAAKDGWKYFRILHDSDNDPRPGEMVCLAEARGIQCRNCCLCNGRKGWKNIVIRAHGGAAVMNSWARISGSYFDV